MMTEDLSAFMNAAEFATPITLNGVAQAAIFDSANTLGAVGPYGMASTQPMLTLPTAQVPASPLGLAVVVGSVSYLVSTHEPDGTGISRLLLELA